MYKFLYLILFLYIVNLTSLNAEQGISLADEYRKNSLFQWGWAMESLKKFPLNKNDKVLDVGCGDGKITAFIASQVHEGVVVGLDISEKMLFHATKNFLSDNLIFLHGDAKAIPFKQQFDKVVSFCTLNWVPEQKQALQCLKDSLKAGGFLLLVVHGKLPGNLGGFTEEMVRSEKWAPYFPNFKSNRVNYTPEEYLSLLNEVGIQIQSFEASETIITYQDKSALISLVRPLMTFIDHLPPELQEEFIEEFVTKQIIEGHLICNPDGTISKRNIKIEVIAFKP